MNVANQRATENTPLERPIGTRPRRDQLCWRCTHRHHTPLFCPNCGAIQPFPEDADYFEILGVPRSLAVDPKLLRQRYYELHRCLHPDRFQTASPEERQTSLRNTALVNQAYRTLKDPEDRGIYWLTLHGEPLGRDNQAVPADIAALVFETQELLEELRAGRSRPEEVAQVRDEIAKHRDTLRGELENFYQAQPTVSRSDDLQRLKHLLSTLSYLDTLLRDVEQTLENHPR